MKYLFTSIGLFLSISLCQADSLPITPEKLFDIAGDQYRAHEMTPNGVPRSYDWQSKPRIGAGLNPGTFRAVTGWGQAFWTGPHSSSLPTLQTRNFQTYICDASSRAWRLSQGGYTDGRVFDATYNNNDSRKPSFYYTGRGFVAAQFDANKAYHFWPREGRAPLPDGGVCGIVILVEAKTTRVESEQSSSPQAKLMVGLGADYWATRTASWDNYKTNRDIAIGRLKLVGNDWAWYGLALGSTEDLNNLARVGFSTEFEK